MTTIQVRTIGDAERECGRDNNFLIIRLVAASAVIYGHAYAISPAAGQGDVVLRALGLFWSGQLAVYAFFVISGYLVACSYLGRGSVVEYTAARCLRIFPGLLVCLLLMVLALGPAMTTLPLAEYFRNAEVRQYFTRNFFLIEPQYFLPGVFTDLLSRGVNGPLWSLLLEGRLYLVLGVLGVCGILSRRRTANTVGVVLAVLGFAWPHSLHYLTKDSNALLCCLLFLTGSLVYINRDHIPLSNTFMLFFVFVAALFHGTPQFKMAFLAVMVYGMFWLAYVPKLPVLNRIGDYSYGVYIYGWPVQQLMKHYFPGTTPLGNFLLSLPATLALAFVSWHLIEKRALALKRVKIFQAVGAGRKRAAAAPPEPQVLALPAGAAPRREAA